MTVLRMVQIIAENLKNFTTKNFSFSNKDTLNKITDTEVYAWGKAAEHAGTQEIHLTDAEKIEVGELVNGKYATDEEVQLVKKSVSDGKSLLAASITGQGINSASSDSFATMAEKISNIFTGVDASSVTANANDVISGKRIVDAVGNIIDGAIPDRSHVAGGASGVVGLDASRYPNVAVSEYAGAIHWSENTDGVKRFCLQVPWGVYGGHSGTRGGDGYVGISVDRFGDATSDNILSGKKATSKNGLSMTGTMPDRGAVNGSVGINSSYTIPAGYHNGSGKVKNTCVTRAASTITPKAIDQAIPAGVYLTGGQLIKGDSNLVSENIKNGTTIFGVTGNMIGVSFSQYVYQSYGANYSSSVQQSPLYVQGLQAQIPLGSNKPSGSWGMSWMSNASGYIGYINSHPDASPRISVILVFEALDNSVASSLIGVVTTNGGSATLSSGTRVTLTISTINGQSVVEITSTGNGSSVGKRVGITLGFIRS